MVAQQTVDGIPVATDGPCNERIIFVVDARRVVVLPFVQGADANERSLMIPLNGFALLHDPLRPISRSNSSTYRPGVCTLNVPKIGRAHV